ncbi:hypothetical protein [Caballeronia sp. NCTM5]|uniref:hypothetical protein n=1 Tax=Caballeronia sp. NCTM5 TaxID=2921755 RepID=UPI002028BBF6|nr:hypothetical protein [Caballeronia sp. NCTM5]
MKKSTQPGGNVLFCPPKRHAKQQQATDMTAKTAGDTPRKKQIRLRNAKDVRRELARLYNETRAGTIETHEATKLAHVLEILRRAIETDDIETRLAELEASE